MLFSSENSSDDEQLPTMVTHGKMIIRATKNRNENINKNLVNMIQSLEHPVIRDERIDRRILIKT